VKMDFVEFAQGHGLIVNQIVTNRWVATPTQDHPRSSNGRYKFLGDVGWVQNWALMEKPATWFAEGKNAQSLEVRQSILSSTQDRDEKAKKAKAKAEWILQQTSLESHPYLDKKGFADQQGNVWQRKGQRILVIPMRHGRELTGCQFIDEQGSKKFLYGQVSKGATFTIGAKGTAIFVEGFATGLSVRTIMQHMNIPCHIHICFSASNVEFVSRNHRNGVIVADNDPHGVGKAAAEKASKPYWISETVGEDFNDYHKRVGDFRASQSLKKTLLSLKTLPQSA